MSRTSFIWIPSQARLRIEEEERQKKREAQGLHADGSFTLCPEAYSVLQCMFLNRSGSGGIQLPDEHRKRICQLADVIYEKQGIDFEVYT